MKKQNAELDLIRAREMLIQENETFLGGVSSDDPYLVYAMAHAAGRVSQMRHCLMAVDRMLITHEGADAVTMMEIQTFKGFLEALERTCVKLHRTDDGRYELLPLSAVFDELADNSSVACH